MKEVAKEIIAFRKACKASGTGLSHYILMDGNAAVMPIATLDCQAGRSTNMSMQKD